MFDRPYWSVAELDQDYQDQLDRARYHKFFVAIEKMGQVTAAYEQRKTELIQELEAIPCIP